MSHTTSPLGARSLPLPCTPGTPVSPLTCLNGAFDGCAGAHFVPLVLLGHMAEYILPDGVLLLQAHIKAEIFLALGPTLGLQASWSKARVPTLLDVNCLLALVRKAGADPARLLRDLSPITALEQSQGNWEAAVAVLASPRGIVPSTVASMAALFDTHVRPSATCHKTRIKAWLGWRAVLSWATAHGCLGHILPMDRETFQGLLWELLQLHCSLPVIKGIINGIQSRHRFFGLVAPINAMGEYSALTFTLARFQGRQRKMTFPIHRDLVHRLLRIATTSIIVWRNCLAGASSSIFCLRPCEGAAAQVCDVWLDFDTLAGYAQFEGGMALNVPTRKNDQARRGHHPRAGRSKDPALDLVWQLRNYMERAGLRQHPACTKRARPHARCEVCPPLFPLTTTSRQIPDALSTRAPGPTAFSRMIVKGLQATGIDTTSFSGACARKGGLSTAIEAGVPEVILWMQSGHSQSRSARSYITLNSPTLLYDTWAAFWL